MVIMVYNELNYVKSFNVFFNHKSLNIFWHVELDNESSLLWSEIFFAIQGGGNHEKKSSSK